MNTIRTFLAFAALATAGAAVAQEELADYVVESCKPDLQKFCSNVTPGEGRLVNCMAAYADQLSPTCRGAVITTALILNDLTDRVQAVAEACEIDLDRHCADVPEGGGRLLACLTVNEDKLRKDCKSALDTLVEDE